MSECRSGRNALVAAYHAVQALFAWFGCQLAYVRRRPHIPDVALYHPTFQPWLSSEWTTRLRVGDPRSIVSPDRKYVLYNLLKQSLASGLGDVAECGVYKGGTAYILADLVRSAGRMFFLFDTFAGMPETDPEKDLHKRGDFDDTSLDDVKHYLAPFGELVYCPGFIPQTLDTVADRRFRFVHIDLDIYESIRSSSAFFYERLERGAIIVYDDYGFASCPGARQAVDEFYAKLPETPLVLSTGQCVVWKL
jgi:O-methyltransferase